MTREDIILLIQNDNWMMDVLRAVKTLNLSDWYVGAGFVRNKVWDTLHSFSKRTPLSDVDVIYFDKNDFDSEEAGSDSTRMEKNYEDKLSDLLNGVNWSVTNQARMHIFHKRLSYISSEEALGEWVETATCVGVRLDENDQIYLVAPKGIDDLVNLVLRPNADLSEFQRRVEGKKWLEKWPKLKVIT